MACHALADVMSGLGGAFDDMELVNDDQCPGTLLLHRIPELASHINRGDLQTAPVRARRQKVAHCGLAPLVKDVEDLVHAQVEHNGSVVVPFACGKFIDPDALGEAVLWGIELILGLTVEQPLDNPIANTVLATDVLDRTATALIGEVMLIATGLPLLPVPKSQNIHMALVRMGNGAGANDISMAGLD